MRQVSMQGSMCSRAHLHYDGILGVSQAVEHEGISHLQRYTTLKKVLPLHIMVCIAQVSDSMKPEPYTAVAWAQQQSTVWYEKGHTCINDSMALSLATATVSPRGSKLACATQLAICRHSTVRPN